MNSWVTQGHYRGLRSNPAVALDCWMVNFSTFTLTTFLLQERWAGTSCWSLFRHRTKDGHFWSFVLWNTSKEWEGVVPAHLHLASFELELDQVYKSSWALSNPISIYLGQNLTSRQFYTGLWGWIKAVSYRNVYDSQLVDLLTSCCHGCSSPTSKGDDLFDFRALLPFPGWKHSCIHTPVLYSVLGWLNPVCFYLSKVCWLQLWEGFQDLQLHHVSHMQ